MDLSHASGAFWQKLEGIDSDDIRETAYEVFFTSCRSSPGFRGHNAISFYSSHDNNNNNGGGDEGEGGGCSTGSGSPTARFNGIILIPIYILSMQQMPFNLAANMYQKLLHTNRTLLSAILTDKAQALAIKEVINASFKAFLMVLLAGGSSPVFYHSDHQMIEEDFDSLKND
ncbi:hypothetical protein WN943_029185 [Citrus x changshan-huyou]